MSATHECFNVILQKAGMQNAISGNAEFAVKLAEELAKHSYEKDNIDMLMHVMDMEDHLTSLIKLSMKKYHDLMKEKTAKIFGNSAIMEDKRMLSYDGYRI